MSALARPNLVDFIDHLIHRLHRLSQITDKPSDRNDLYNQRNRRNLRMNVCDAESYEFNQIIQTFKQSGFYPNRPTLPIPLSIVWPLARTAGFLLPKKGGFARGRAAISD